MIKVVFLGFGNLNFHVCRALHLSGKVTTLQIFNRNPMELPQEFKNIPFTSSLSEIVEADVYITGIPDDAISDFSKALVFKNRLVVHTSGAVAMQKLSSENRRGVFYPLQTFSKARPVDFSEIPILIEADDKTDLELLKKLGSFLSNNVQEISSEKRAKLHLAAVFVNNFTNYLFQIASDLLDKEDLEFELLKPLIKETLNKLDNLSPFDAQSGPAKRKDLKSIKKHLDLMDNDSEEKKIYQVISDALIEKYHGG